MIELHNEDELNYYLSLKPSKKWHHTTFSFNCSVCKLSSTRRLDSIKYPFMCKGCASKLRHKEHPEYAAAASATKIARYGGVGFASSNGRQVLEKIKQTYGGIGFSSKQCTDKYKSTMTERYGCEYPLQSDELSSKFRATMKSLYGEEHPSNCEEIRQRANSTYIEHHGAIGFASEGVLKKYIDTCAEKYGIGVDPSKTFDANKNNRRKYIYNENVFDSGWELAYFTWLSDNNKDFIYHPNVKFTYYDNGKEHTYRPDFVVDGTYIEIKGRHLINSDGILIDPFTKRLLVSKSECLRRNNVVIITDCSVYIKYVQSKYGKRFISSCRIRRD